MAEAAAQPLVSVVVPVRDGERYIGEAIRSVLAQTLDDFDLIVIDDGSTDRTAEIVEAFPDDRIRLVRQPPLGPSRAMNEGLHRSRAEFIARLDADDAMEPHRLERQVAFLRARPDLGGAATAYLLMDEAGRIHGARQPPLLTTKDLELQLILGGQLIYPHPTVMLRRQAVLAVGGYNPDFDRCEDVDLFLRMYETGRPLLVQPEPLTRFRIHSNSVSARQVRAQHFLNEAIFDNFHRRRRGMSGLPVTWYVERARRSPWAWVSAEARILSSRLHRRSTLAGMSGRSFAAMAALAAAGVVHPPRALGAAARSAVRTLRGAGDGRAEITPQSPPGRPGSDLRGRTT